MPSSEENVPEHSVICPRQQSRKIKSKQNKTENTPNYFFPLFLKGEEHHSDTVAFPSERKRDPSTKSVATLCKNFPCTNKRKF